MLSGFQKKKKQKKSLTAFGDIPRKIKRTIKRRRR